MMATKKAVPAVQEAEPDAGSGKELRVQLAMMLPADMFAQAEIIAGLRGPLDALRKALPGATVTHSIVTPRAPKIEAPAEPTALEQAIEQAID